MTATQAEHEPVHPFPDGATDFPWPAGKTLGGTFRWTGTAGFRLGVGDTSIAFDPFVTRPGLFRTFLRRARSDDGLVAERYADLDAAFAGHTHFDHAMDLPAIARVSPGAQVHGGHATVELCRRLGVAPDNLVRVKDGECYDVGPFTIEVVASAHGVVPLLRWIDRINLPARGLPWTPFRYPRGEVFAWRIEVGDRTFHVQGSAGIDDAALERQAPADVLFACLAARHGTDRYLKRLGDRLQPKVLVPLHHDSFYRPLSAAPRPVAFLRWSAFLDDARALAEAWNTRLWCPPFDIEVGI